GLEAPPRVNERWRYMNLPEVKVSERFTGQPGAGADLRNYLKQIDNIRHRWTREGLEAEEFYRGLSNTLAGEAETYYRIIKTNLLCKYRNRGSEDWGIVEEFLDKLKQQFSMQTPEKIHERRLIGKFLNGMDQSMVKELWSKVFEMGWEASLQQVYELACRYETGLKLYELERAESRNAERRRGVWMATPQVDSVRREEAPVADRRQCHRCWQTGHIQRDCSHAPRCDTC
ncbi:unnamed protein product, partial [Closterium sp. NIES-53]